MSAPRFLLQGDRGLVVEFGQQIHTDLVKQVRVLAEALKGSPLVGIQESIPTYRSLLIRYDPLQLDVKILQKHLEILLMEKQNTVSLSYVTEIPVFYGGGLGPDLAQVAKYSQRSTEEVVKIHSSVDYLIYMLGFTPGFPYLGGLPREIACPRLLTPRTLVAAGSVGIADEQTGIYPMASPGGWQIIGQTPLRLFDPERESPILLEAGHYLRFLPVTREEFNQIKVDVAENRYVAKRTLKVDSV